MVLVYLSLQAAVNLLLFHKVGIDLLVLTVPHSSSKVIRERRWQTMVLVNGVAERVGWLVVLRGVGLEQCHLHRGGYTRNVRRCRPLLRGGGERGGLVENQGWS